MNENMQDVTGIEVLLLWIKRNMDMLIKIAKTQDYKINLSMILLSS